MTDVNDLPVLLELALAFGGLLATDVDSGAGSLIVGIGCEDFPAAAASFAASFAACFAAFASFDFDFLLKTGIVEMILFPG